MNKSNKEIFRKRLAKQSVWSKPWFYLVMVLVLVLNGPDLPNSVSE